VSTEHALAGAVAALFDTEGAETRELVARVEGMLTRMPLAAQWGFRAGNRLLDSAALTLTGHHLAALDVDRREGVCDAVARRPGGSQLLDALKMPVVLAASPGHRAARNGDRGAGELVRPDPELDCTPSAEWPTCTVADVVVVGSGAAGAMVARTCARAGLAVVVVEEGRRFTSAEFRAREPLDRFLDLYRDGGATLMFGRSPVVLPIGRGVGGTTLVNSGTCYRTPDRVLRRWRHDHGIELVDRFPELLDEVERTLHVARQPLDVLGRNGLLALEGARALDWLAAPLRRNAPGCLGSCQCAVGCPSNAKTGVHLNALPDACGAGARIVSEARVERVLVDRREHAAGIAARRPDGSPFEILSPIVVVAAGATETPPLLRRSRLGRHPQVGRGLAVHPATSIAGRFAEPVVAWHGVLQSVGIEQLHDDGILIEATSTPPGLGTFVLPGVGRRLRAELAAADHLAFLGAMVADAPSGRVYGARRSVLRYDLAEDDARKLRRAMVAMGRVLFAAGAREVLTGLPVHPVAASVVELEEIVATTKPSALHLAAFHPTGSVRMSADPELGPVDTAGRLRGVEGVYVADASVLPTCPEVNPQVSIMAMALGIADGVCAAA
jgi:choline dehydrogenase-like flavoprotein